MTPDDALKLWWIPLLVTVVGGLVIAGILAIFRPGVRDKFWRPLGRAVAWVFSIRLTTTKRQRDAAAEARALRERADAAEAGREQDQKVMIAEHELRLKGLGVTHADELRAEARRGYQKGLEDAAIELAMERELPRVSPVWRIDYVKDAVWELRNTQTGAVVSDVTLECDLKRFAFTGPSQWPGPFAGVGQFEGHRLRLGQVAGVDFTVRYRDELGDHATGAAWLDKASAKRAYFG